jgi:hypothetical protein
MKRTAESCVFAVVAAVLLGCDHMWVRQSSVVVTRRNFPACVESAMRSVGLEPKQIPGSSGNARLVASYLSGVLNVTTAEDQSQPLKLEVIGRGRNPPSEEEQKIAEELNSISAAIVRTCSDG